MTDLELGHGQMKVMRVLWKKKHATAHEILEILNRDEKIKRSTVQTFLRTLVRKGLVGYDIDKRTFIFYPLVKREKVTQHAFTGFIEHIFEGSIEGLVSYIINKEKISPQELERIIKLVEDKE